jgi:sigma-E factor negative regulatory protein RseC
VKTNLISHEGTIISTNNQHLIVKIISETACASCHAKGSCTSADQTEKEITVQRPESDFFIGERVLVETTLKQGYKAVFYAYLLPLIILIISLMLLISFTGNEAISALVSISFLFPYYLLLYLLRNKLQNSFKFMVQKLPNISL